MILPTIDLLTAVTAADHPSNSLIVTVMIGCFVAAAIVSGIVSFKIVRKKKPENKDNNESSGDGN